MSIQKYPVGHQDFEKIISEGFVYVDKTKFVLNLAERGGYYFLSRPRRFGKSLFVSTLEHLFRGNKNLFNNLFIADKWTFEEYPVIKISFSNIGYRTKGLFVAIEDALNALFDKYNLKSSSRAGAIDDKFKELIGSLEEKFGKQVVVLIDEYDKPLIDYLDKENLYKAIENRSILKSFYSILKDADPHLKMVFITGVSKFSQVSIFSDLNNLKDISISSDYNEICGVSQMELEINFVEEMKLYDREKIKEWYNGYKWHIAGNTVYNPFSLLSFFDNKGQFQNFWYTTGTPTFLIKKSREERMYQFDKVKSSVFKLQAFDIEDIDLVAVLFQTGYLTIVDKDEIFDSYILSYPNKEVKQAYLEKLTDMYLFGNGSPSKIILDNLLEAMRKKDKVQLVQTINQAFAQIPYDLWQKENEHFYHAIIHLLFSLLGVYIFSEVHSKQGRADAIVIFENHIYCLEFKLNKTAEEAITQIKERAYLDKFIDTSKTKHLIGINFSSEKKEVDGIVWEISPK